MSRSFDDALIETVRSYPALYKSLDRKDKSLTVRATCWREIAKKLKRKPDECKRQWRNIRDNYKRIVNQKRTGRMTCTSKYDTDKLKFLDESFQDRQRYDAPSVVNSIEVLEFDEKDDYIMKMSPSTSSNYESHEDTTSPLPIHVSESFYNDSTNIITTDTDRSTFVEDFNILREHRLPQGRSTTTPVHTFFSSMADVVCEFPPDKIAQIRSKVCNLVTEMELSILAHCDNKSLPGS